MSVAFHVSELEIDNALKIVEGEMVEIILIVIVESRLDLDLGVQEGTLLWTFG